MKPMLVLKMGQQLTMTPQLQQAIRLLQLSSLDLQQEVQEALEANPMLEMADEGDDDFSSDTTESDHASETADTSGDDDAPAVTLPEPATLDTIEQSADSSEDAGNFDQIPSELSVDTSWEDIYQTSASSLPSNTDDEWDFTSRTSSDVTLQSHLEWQVNLLPLSDTDREIATALIDGINADGYLGESLEDIQLSLDPELGVELDEIEMVLHRIQQLEPVGVGARDLSECLHLQLCQLPADTPMLEQAKRLVRDYLELLGSRDFTQLMRRTRLKEDQLREVVDLILTLNPRPGGEIASGEAEYVIPDVLVRRDGNRWLVELNQEAAPRVRVNSHYASMVRRADNSADNTFMRSHLQEARWFIKSLQSRNETLLKVSTQIVEHQRGFLEFGEEAMKPLVLSEIAEAVGMHESTISRVTTQKYMHTPRGIFELKYFFSSHVSGDAGEVSSTAIRALIRKLVAAENPKKPLSDSKIAGLLEEQGIQVARRTIAKYRESLSIPSSSERKRLI